MKCRRCKDTAQVALPSHNTAFCPDCFLEFFSRQVDKGIKAHNLLSKDDKALVALSGGKDSLALALELTRQGYNVTGLHIDLDIGYSSETARQVVEIFCAKHEIPLIIKEMRDEGLSIPKVKAALKRPICSACGKIKRYYFNKIAMDANYDCLATGHNLDDEVARLTSNTLRWDPAYLSDQGPYLPAVRGFMRKIKPLWRLTEFETANYSHLMGIENHYAPCPYSAGASFTQLKQFWIDLELAMPSRKIEFYQGFLERGRPAFQKEEKETGKPLQPCERCGYPTSAAVCGVCRIKEIVVD